MPTATHRLARPTLLAVGLFAGGAFAQGLTSEPAPEGTSVRIISPSDGDTVPAEFTVVFGLSGMGIAPAGVDQDGTAHHHLLVDTDQIPAQDQPMGNPPLHFGGGQTETVLTLEPGEHTLQLVLGNYLHVPHSPPIVSEQITVTVEPDGN